MASKIKNNETYWAFFDVDETVINLKSMFTFLKYFYETVYGSFFSKLLYIWAVSYLKVLIKLNVTREFVNKNYYQLYRNIEPELLNKIGQNWFDNLISTKKNLFNERVLDAMKEHQRKGGSIVFVSGSFEACIKPIAEYLKVKHYICTTLQISKGRYSGKILGSPVIGEGKAVLVRDFLNKRNFSSLDLCYAYGDHISDLPMLKIVGNSVVVRGDKSLEAYGTKHGWKLI